jgi:threonine aldolase
MANQIALKVHTRPLDEVICDETSHIYQYEVGGYAFHSGIGIQLLPGKNGVLEAHQVAAAIRPNQDWLPKSTLVVLENTCNKGGGSFYTLDEIRPIQKVCQERGLALHLDGARVFNALVETGETTQETGELFDSISICLSKGLGTPVGSLLIGTKAFIRQARRVRKAMGGGMRQAGFLAAAGIYALDNHVERLKEDNDRAKNLGKVLEKLTYVDNVRPVQSNIVIFDLKAPWTAESYLARLAEEGIKASAFGPQTVRFVTHLDVTADMIDQVVKVIASLAV